MTVAVYVKVFDGIVLATDSATTLTRKGILGIGKTDQVYNNADKIFHLHRDVPMAAMTWGLGVVGPASISSLSKSFRLGLMGRDPLYSEGPIDITSYNIEDIAQRASRMFAQAARGSGLSKWPNELGYLVAGMSSDSAQAEAWLLRFAGKELEPEPEQVLTENQYGFRAYAQPEAVNRLFNGYDDRLADMFITAGIQGGATPDAAKAQVETTLGAFHLDPVQEGMPLPDAIALARFMVETTEGYARYRMGPDTVGGPVEVASISPHEGFKWISRKHYYSPALNPGEQP
ncbi:hypothetical protein [Mycobacterium sp.]|uniref:hypothetical protein n=1 Tax=Mycobacterium sp. TaxID=1785 RepID=UPI003D0DC2E1